MVALARFLATVVLAAAVVGATATQAAGDVDPFAERRAALMRELQSLGVRDSRQAARRDFDSAVIDAMDRTPRHEFVPEDLRRLAYANRPLPIGYGQTISQPYVVAWMTDALRLEPGDRVLEVGTGSGYQAAVLAPLVEAVYTIEIIEALGETAAARLARLGYDSVQVRVGDGYYGWPERAPFDAIIVTAAASHVPPPLIKQLKPGGRMVIPVGGRFTTQLLLLIEKTDNDEIVTRQIAAVRFVPLTGEH